MQTYDIKYVLTAYVDNEIVFEEEFYDTASLEESGLRKAEYSVEDAITEVEND